LSATNIILDSTGTIKTIDYAAGVFGTDTEIETKTSSESGTITLDYSALSIVSVTVGGSDVTYTYVPQTKTLTNLVDTSTEHVITYIREDTTAGTGWKIDSTGDAVFNDVTVFGTLYSSGGNIAGWDINEGYLANGNIVLNTSGEIYTANYNHRISGWKIRWDGFAEFNEVLVRGEIESGSGNIGGWLITETTIESEGETGIIMDSTGSIGSKNFVIGSEGWKIFDDGTAEFNHIIIRDGSFEDGTVGGETGLEVSAGLLQDPTGTLVIDSVNKKIKIGSYVELGSNVKTTDYIGLKITSDNYWETNGTYTNFSLGTKLSYTDSSGSGVLSVEGEVKATSGYIGGSSSGWHIDTDVLYAGTSTDIYSILLDSNNTKINIYRPDEIGYPAVSLGMAVLTGKHGLAFYDNTDGTSNNYWVWDTNEVKFRVGTTTSYLDFNVGTADKLKIVTDTFSLSTTNLTIDSATEKIAMGSIVLQGGTSPYIGIGTTSYSGAGIWLGKDSTTWKASFYANTNNYLKWTGSALDINVNGGVFRVTTAGALTATSATITGSITATGGTIAGWTIDGNILYSGTSTTIYDIMLDAGNKVIGLNRETGMTQPSIKLGYNVYDSKHGIVFYDSTGNVYNYWVWDSDTISSSAKFKLGTATNYISLSGTTLTIKTDTFNLATTHLAIDSANEKIAMGGIVLQGTTYPYIGLGITSYSANDGIWLGNDSGTYKLSIKNSTGSKYFLWDGSNLSLDAGNMSIDTSG
ncbi:MAG: hypothetical protein WC942_07830, partial [Clostridia bacterium]